MTDTSTATRGRLYVNEGLELVVRDERAPASTSIRGELVGAADELVEQFTLTLVASPQTQRTYRRACGAFTAWLGSLAGPEDLTAANVAAYHAELVRSGRASSTVKKERAALNSFLRWLVEFEHISALQARQALAVKLPRAEQARRERPKDLGEQHYDDLIRAAKAAIADDPLAGARDLAIVLVLGDAGLRCEELAGLQRRDVHAARKGAKLRTLQIRHGKGDRARQVKLSERATRAIVRAREFGPPTPGAALFIRSDAGARMARTQASADAVVSRSSPP
jgi:site-specific recombinase XerC